MYNPLCPEYAPEYTNDVTLSLAQIESSGNGYVEKVLSSRTHRFFADGDRLCLPDSSCAKAFFSNHEEDKSCQ